MSKFCLNSILSFRTLIRLSFSKIKKFFKKLNKRQISRGSWDPQVFVFFRTLKKISCLVKKNFNLKRNFVAQHSKQVFDSQKIASSIFYQIYGCSRLFSWQLLLNLDLEAIQQEPYLVMLLSSLEWQPRMATLESITCPFNVSFCKVSSLGLC